MAGPRRKFRERPKKTGARKTQKVNAQKKRLVGSGMPEEQIGKLTVGEIRDRLKAVGRKKSKIAVV